MKIMKIHKLTKTSSQALKYDELFKWRFSTLYES